jgi:hypothetical protein
VQRDAELPEIVLALGPASGFATLLNGGQEQGYQQTDDCEDHQEFGQRESPLWWHAAYSRGHAVRVSGARQLIQQSMR